MHVCMNRKMHTKEDIIRSGKLLHSSLPPTSSFGMTVYRGKCVYLVKHGRLNSFTFHYSNATKEL